jgi:hypothetical protein
VPLEVSVAVMLAPEMTAPEASVTVPVILALMSCPKAMEHMRDRNKLLSAMRAFIGRPPILLSNLLDLRGLVTQAIVILRFAVIARRGIEFDPRVFVKSGLPNLVL